MQDEADVYGRGGGSCLHTVREYDGEQDGQTYIGCGLLCQNDSVWFLLLKGVNIENGNEETIVDTILNWRCQPLREDQKATLATHCSMRNQIEHTRRPMSITSQTILPLYDHLNHY